jgi:hypothetical protein
LTLALGGRAGRFSGLARIEQVLHRHRRSRVVVADTHNG